MQVEDAGQQAMSKHVKIEILPEAIQRGGIVPNAHVPEDYPGQGKGHAKEDNSRESLMIDADFGQVQSHLLPLTCQRQPSPDGAPCAPYGARPCCAFYHQYAGMVLDSNSVPV